MGSCNAGSDIPNTITEHLNHKKFNDRKEY